MGIAVVIILQIFRPNAMKHISTFLPLMVSFMMSACVYGGSTELSGELVQQHHSLDAFNSIHVKTGVQLILTQGETYAAMVEADRISADASSGAHIKAADFIALGGVAEASSGAHVTLFVNGSADAKASSGGKVRVLGDVALKSIESSSGGSISTR